MDELIIIGGRIPSKKNSVVMFVRNGKLFKMPSNQYRAWHEGASWELKKYKRKFPKPIGKADMQISFFLPDARRTDLTNKAESIMDLLVDNGILEDDNCSIVPKLTLLYNGIDRDNPRAEINIKQYAKN